MPKALAEEKNPLPGLPELPEQPPSLFAPEMAAPPGSGQVSPPPCYFDHDPRLDPPPLPPPGWFSNAEIGILDPHVKNKLTNTVSLGGITAPNTVAVPRAPLDWTVSPCIELGYRLSDGFGEFLVAYQIVASKGNGTAIGADALAALQSRLDINTLDFDYASREWSLLPCCWDMKWEFGLRFSSIYFDSTDEEPVGAAAAGSGIFEQHDSNRFLGVGPHMGLELAKRWDDYNLALVVHLDGWISLGRLRQGFSEESTILGSNGVPLSGLTVEDRSQAVPQLKGQVGLLWEPPGGCHHAYFFAGYQYEYWWNVGRDSSELPPASRGELNDQGIYLRAEINF